ncbi:helix-turn-helix domain-containing protein [Hamadaea sp. NPDC051192]|uniref:helix-turn-helix transcriptional regulator n=1 Tax=Hamadaea sp. NPDC051192 TaxID=3154940 RepID=UPI00343B897F
MNREQPTTDVDRTAHGMWSAYVDACMQLGRQLAAYRKHAGWTQKHLAAVMRRSISAISAAENGHNPHDAGFWRTADLLLITGGTLAQAWVAVAQHKQAADAQAATERARKQATLAHEDQSRRCLNPADCLCLIAVAYWTGREIRALRVALRYGFPDWAHQLDIDLETVYGWEKPHATTPRLEHQLLLDRLLADAPIHARSRFRQLASASPLGSRPEPPTAPTMPGRGHR